jgi:hypothetical protein
MKEMITQSEAEKIVYDHINALDPYWKENQKW